MRFVIVIASVVALSGCGWIAQSQVRKYERKVITYERLAPDAEALGRGDTRSTIDMLGLMDDWTGHIGQQDLPPIERQKLVDRLHAAKRHYLLGASQLTDSPDLGYALATSALTEGDREALAIVRKLADARAARRQAQFPAAKTYAIVKRGELGTTTSSNLAIHGGHVSGTTSTRTVLKPGNCVFATRPFGAEGTPNPGLTFRIVGKASVHVRCYLNRDLYALPERDGELEFSVEGEDVFPTVSRRIPLVRAEGMQFVDFVLHADVFDDRREFAATRVTLTYSYTKDLVVVWDHGAQRLRKERPRYELSESPVFWDRDGEPLSSVAATAPAPARGTPRPR